MNDQQLIRAMVQRLTPGQAASLRDQAREELAKLRAQTQPPPPRPTAPPTRR